MLFSSITFIYYFLPVVILLYFIVPFRFKNLVLFCASIFFYFWGEPVYTLIMIFTALSGYLHGLLIDQFRGTKASKVWVVSSIVVSLAVLGLFKYSDFFVETWNGLFKTDVALLKLALPIGISFYTFQTLSYTIDLYRGTTKVQKNFLNFATYVVLFPQLIAGPIVRYVDVEKELTERKHNFENFAYGVNRFVLGMAKKVLLANQFGELCEIFKATDEKTIVFYWVYALAYALHIYFDFSGYSDMAIGLGRIFGFHFPENFNYPYISKSITEFWRRWHITLSSWFRDYVYIPLGGNRVSKLKWFRNILIVWALTGMWHGAGWNFIAWGLFFAVLLILEKAFLGDLLKKIPAVFSWFYTMILVFISWILFDAESIQMALSRIVAMFGGAGIAFNNSVTSYYFISYAFLLEIGCIGATPLCKILVNKLKEKEWANRVVNVLEPIVQVVLLLVVTAYLVDGSFNPFLYFRF
ncbi:MAG: MBOAT family protein [Clostridia bacterium]|nr:MBOAT family protein [Clostridia bacterium]